MNWYIKFDMSEASRNAKEAFRQLMGIPYYSSIYDTYTCDSLKFVKRFGYGFDSAYKEFKKYIEFYDPNADVTYSALIELGGIEIYIKTKKETKESTVKVIFDESIQLGSYEWSTVHIILGKRDPNYGRCYSLSKNYFKSIFDCPSVDYAITEFRKRLDMCGIDATWQFVKNSMNVEITLKKKIEVRRIDIFLCDASPRAKEFYSILLDKQSYGEQEFINELVNDDWKTRTFGEAFKVFKGLMEASSVPDEITYRYFKRNNRIEIYINKKEKESEPMVIVEIANNVPAGIRTDIVRMIDSVSSVYIGDHFNDPVQRHIANKDFKKIMCGTTSCCLSTAFETFRASVTALYSKAKLKIKQPNDDFEDYELYIYVENHPSASDISRMQQEAVDRVFCTDMALTGGYVRRYNGRYPYKSTAIPKKFSVYSGIEHSTGKRKTVVKWSDGHTETVYNCRNHSEPIIAVSYAHCKRRFGTNSAFKKYVDKHTKPLFSSMVMFDDGDSQATCRTSRIMCDIYDMAAIAIATKCYGLDKMNEMIGGDE